MTFIKKIIHLLIKLIKFFLKKFGIDIVRKRNLYFPVIEADKRIVKLIDSALKYSMTTKLRMHVLSQAIKYVNDNKIKGDFVECGVWSGGNIILAKELFKLFKIKKNIYAYDTFEGMPKPDMIDKNLFDGSANKLMSNSPKISGLNNVHAYTSYEQVLKNIKDNTDLKNIKFIKGRVEETLLINKNLPKKISILRLDTDFYSSTKIELEILYERLSKGGVLIIDDYGDWLGARKAVDQFFNKKKWLHYVDNGCRYILK